jgi:hypothetical protein
MFKFLLYEEVEMGFYWAGAEYYYFPSGGDYDSLREDYERYFALFDK